MFFVRKLKYIYNIYIYGLETVELELAGTVEDAVTVVDPVTDEAVHEHENRFMCERVTNHTHTTQLEKQERHI